jgi:hypothetical protein
MLVLVLSGRQRGADQDFRVARIGRERLAVQISTGRHWPACGRALSVVVSLHVVLVAGPITSIHADVCAPVAVSVTLMLNVPSGAFAPAFMNV